MSTISKEEIQKLGFLSWSHFRELERYLAGFDMIERALINVSCEMTISMSHLSKFREIIYDDIYEISEKIETFEADSQILISDFIERNM